MLRLYVRGLALIAYTIAVLGFFAPALISAASTISVMAGVALVASVPVGVWYIGRPVFAAIFN